MKTYNDYSYIKDLLKYSFDDVLDIYSNILEEKSYNNSWELYLAEIAAKNYNDNFYNYRKRQKENCKNKNMTDNDRQKIESKVDLIKSNMEKKGTRVNINSLK